MKNGHEMFHHPGRTLRFLTKEGTRALLPLGGSTIPTTMSHNDRSANLLLGVTPPWLHFGAHRRKASQGSGIVIVTIPDPVSCTSIEARVSLNTAGGLYRGKW